MLLVGTSLATYSAYRLLKQAYEAKKGVAMLNVGTSRGDDLGEPCSFRVRRLYKADLNFYVVQSLAICASHWARPTS